MCTFCPFRYKTGTTGAAYPRSGDDFGNCMYPTSRCIVEENNTFWIDMGEVVEIIHKEERESGERGRLGKGTGATRM